jgi:hypothetical protein
MSSSLDVLACRLPPATSHLQTINAQLVPTDEEELTKLPLRLCRLNADHSCMHGVRSYTERKCCPDLLSAPLISRSDKIATIAHP